MVHRTYQVIHFSDTEIAGYPVLKLWVSCREHNDMDIRVQIRKLDKDGNCRHNNAD